jgi:hypothetical protein
LRRLIILAALIITLVAVYQLSVIAQDWHYVVPAEDGAVLYATTFDGTMPDWEQDERGDFSHQVVAGAMQIVANADDVGPYSAITPYFDAFNMQVEAEIVSGDFSGGNNNAFGVIFRLFDRSNYYLFLISGDGFYRVQRVTEGRLTELSTWNPSDAIDIGPGAKNTLRVTGLDDTFTFFINGEPVELCIPNAPDGISTINPLTGACIDGQWTTELIDDTHPYGRLGVVVDADEADRIQDETITVTFDNVIVTGLSDVSTTD